MGSFAKRLGQLATKSLETDSMSIMKTIAANKVPNSLAKQLDTTLREGHDMKVFGVGTMASMASIERYRRFTTSMHAVYSSMEEEMDRAGPHAAPLVHAVWAQHGDVLRRAPSLALDLEDVGGPAALSSSSTERYVAAIRIAGADDRERGGARMLGHLYCRYFADLFGGSMLARPTRAALRLADGTPRNYTFTLPSDEAGGRRAYIEAVYASLNEAGAGLVNLQEREQTEALSKDSALADFKKTDRWQDVVDEVRDMTACI
jgi:heme oxygenase